MFKVTILSLLLAVVVVPCQASVFLGCFNTTVQKQFMKKTSLQNCATICTVAKYPLTIYQKTSASCFCGNIIPSKENQIACTCCSTSVYYNDISNGKQCKISDMAFSDTNFEIPWGRERVTLGNIDMNIKMMPYSCDGGRMNTKSAFRYGMFSVDMLIDGSRGLTSAFYLKSSKRDINVGDDEIDIEFINGRPAKTSGALWLNDFYHGKSQKISMFETNSMRNLTRVPTFSTLTAYHTYTIFWQPNFIRWYVDGHFIDQKTGTVPNLFQFPTFSFWSYGPKKSGVGTPWGGWCDTNVNRIRKLSAKNFRYITCQ